MVNFISKKNIRIIGKEVLQYLILFLCYVIVSRIAYTPKFYFGEQGSVFSFSGYEVFTFLLMLVTLLIIATKPTPITVILFGYITFRIFGSKDQVFFMMLFPLTYFMTKKDFYKTFKNRVIIVIIGGIFLLVDQIISWYQYKAGYTVYEMVMSLIALIITSIYIVHKPVFVRKFFTTTEERKESRVFSLSTRIMMVFSVAVICIIGVVFETMDGAIKTINKDVLIHEGTSISKDITAYFQKNGLTQSTLEYWLDENGENYEGICGRDAKNDSWSFAYWNDAEIKVDDDYIKNTFEHGYQSIYRNDNKVDISESLSWNDHHLKVLAYHISGADNQNIYDIYLIKNIDNDYSNEKNLIRESFKNFFAVFCLGIPVFFWIIELMITRPINLMTGLVSEYAFENEEKREILGDEFNKLDIKTGDEIENLYRSFGKTILDINSYIDSLNLKNEQIRKMQLSIIMTMANVVENRDSNTGMHIKRTAEYVEIIARKMQEDDRFKAVLTDKYVENMKIAAPLHDMGKIHISDIILNKPGKLDDNEYAIMKTHTTEGKNLLKQAIKDFGEFDYLVMAVEMAGAHHERYDGRGYPEGIKGEEIPICARIMAVADVFDALVSKRSYKEGMPLAKAYSIIEEGRGTQFDPDVVDAFMASRTKIENYYNSAD